MIVTEVFKTRADGVVLIRTYSDAGYQIERNGVLYDEAIDPTDANRVYTESKTLKEEELTAEEALAIILGGEV